MRVFQFTHPVRGATKAAPEETRELLFQFTHPVRGATHNLFELICCDPVSIHAPVRGATGECLLYAKGSDGFNSRTP